MNHLGNVTFLSSQKQLNKSNHHNLPSNEQKNIINSSSQNNNSKSPFSSCCSCGVRFGFTAIYKKLF